MTKKQSLAEIIQSERLAQDSPEMQTIIESRNEIQRLIQSEYGHNEISIRYGGSKAKGTILLREHDSDLLVYFHRNNESAGSTLSEIYHAIKETLETQYHTEPGTTSLRVFRKSGNSVRSLKVDVVPGRFVHGSDGNVHLHQNGGAKDYLLTNPEKHIQHVTQSGVVPALCGLKLWKIMNAVAIKQFPFELLCIDLLSPLKKYQLEDQIRLVLESIAEMDSPPRVEDPANPSNDVSSALKITWPDVQMAARGSIQRLDYGWTDALGLPDKASRDEQIFAMAASVRTPTKPWAN